MTNLKFIRYEKREGKTVARFSHTPFLQKSHPKDTAIKVIESVFPKWQLELRIENLEALKIDVSIEKNVLANWPEV